MVYRRRRYFALHACFASHKQKRSWKNVTPNKEGKCTNSRARISNAIGKHLSVPGPKIMKNYVLFGFVTIHAIPVL